MLLLCANKQVVRDLNGYSEQEFLTRVRQCFECTAVAGGSARPQRIAERRQIGMCLSGDWYLLKAKPGTYEDSDPVRSLDVQVYLHAYIWRTLLSCMLCSYAIGHTVFCAVVSTM
jgi:uncharacterized protein (DUF1015 family)